MQEQWKALYKLAQENPIRGVSLIRDVVSFRVEEEFNGKVLFNYERFVDGGRATHVDLTGFVGLASLKLSGPLVLTEGVSDFITVKGVTGLDALGQTNLNLNYRQLQTLKQLNREIRIVTDNDETGIREAFKKRFSLVSLGLVVKVFTPTPYKDITEAWMHEPNYPNILI